MDILYLADLIGTLVFALSGLLIASKKEFDIFGAFVIAFVTALGGGTLRDVLLGRLPVGWIQDQQYIYVVIAACVLGLGFKKYIFKLSKTLYLFDAIGLGVFTVLGLQISLDTGVSPFIALMMGTISAVFGGVLRDVLCNEPPLIFRKEFYATPCILGGLLYLILNTWSLPLEFTIFITVSFIFIIRELSVKYSWSLPKLSI